MFRLVSNAARKKYSRFSWPRYFLSSFTYFLMCDHRIMHSSSISRCGDSIHLYFLAFYVAPSSSSIPWLCTIWQWCNLSLPDRWCPNFPPLRRMPASIGTPTQGSHECKQLNFHNAAARQWTKILLYCPTHSHTHSLKPPAMVRRYLQFVPLTAFPTCILHLLNEKKYNFLLDIKVNVFRLHCILQAQ